jgi:hypothetical protein
MTCQATPRNTKRNGSYNRNMAMLWAITPITLKPCQSNDFSWLRNKNLSPPKLYTYELR